MAISSRCFASGIGADPGHCQDIGQPPGRIQPVDPDHDFPVAEASGADGLGDHGPGAFLGLGRHGIFEIQNECVGRQFAGRPHR